jgi:DNA-binding response OmpR family regulator
LGDKGEGLINVYVHYLREKLEVGGEKIINSSRKNGYAIDEKFIKEDV